MNVRVRFERLLRPRQIAHAHCDIPCGIYDPHLAQLGAETVEKMTQLIVDAGNAGGDPAALNSIARYVAIKEQHAELVKHEIRIIWGDYFKPEHLEAHPDLHAKVWNIMKVASACRQQVSLEAARELRAAVDEFAAMFQQTKQG